MRISRTVHRLVADAIRHPVDLNMKEDAVTPGSRDEPPGVTLSRHGFLRMMICRRMMTGTGTTGSIPAR